MYQITEKESNQLWLLPWPGSNLQNYLFTSWCRALANLATQTVVMKCNLSNYIFFFTTRIYLFIFLQFLAKPEDVLLRKFAWLFTWGMKIDWWKKICNFLTIRGFYLPSLHSVYHCALYPDGLDENGTVANLYPASWICYM